MAPLIFHTAEHGVPITLPRGMGEEEKEVSIRYGTYASSNKEVEFINADLGKQVQAGHVNVFPLEFFNYLHNLWLSPVAVIPQVGRRLRLTFDFTWSGLNDVSKRLAPIEAMRFGGALQHPQAVTHHQPSYRASPYQQDRLDRRIHEAVCEDGGRPIRHLPHPQGKNSKT